MATIDRELNDNERLVFDFVHAAYGTAMDVDAMTALLHEDFVWQLNVPLSPIGRDAAKAALEQQAGMSSGMVDGSEIRTVVSTGDTVVVERVDVNQIGETPVTFYVAAIFDVRDGHTSPSNSASIRCWCSISWKREQTLGEFTARRAGLRLAVVMVIKKLVPTLALACGALVVSSATASAWPIPITPDQQRYINQARGAGFPGDDDAVLQAGMQACHALYARQGVQGAIDTVAGQAGVTPDLAGVAVRLARGSLCTQAPS